ncbi:LysR substrate-binding domain-containing protein [Castellaniella sp.]|uniref:LysR family transcriptional regulator n=1 Tax=Castellaniella sp. TaxID=1955812 RepID=UPI00355D8D74
MLEIRHLETLMAIRQGGSLQEAAERLHVTQSALSHQLRDLEVRLKVALLNRRTRPARLTTAGLRLVALAEDVLPRMRAAEQELSRLAAGRAGRLHVAIDCHSCFQWLMPTLDTFRKDWPEVALDLTAAFAFAPLPALLRGDVDVVVTSDPQPLEGLVYANLFAYELVLAVSSRSPLAQSTSLSPEDLQGQTLITYPVERSRLDVFTGFLDPAGVEPHALRTAELTPMIVQLVLSGRGVAALPSWTLDEYRDVAGLVICRLGNGIWRTLRAAVRLEDEAAPYLQAFVKQARETSFATLPGIRATEPGGGAATEWAMIGRP